MKHGDGVGENPLVVYVPFPIFGKSGNGWCVTVILAECAKFSEERERERLRNTTSYEQVRGWRVFH